MAFSELEMSQLDPGKRGKRMWVDSTNASPSPGTASGTPSSEGSGKAFAGTLETIHAGKAVVERLSVRIDVERFTANGAHVYLIASIDSDRPSELRLSVFAEQDSPPLDELTLTATMGNYERLRLLWLKNSTDPSPRNNPVDSHALFANYSGNAFVEGDNYPLPEMLRSGEGDAIVFASSDEANPATTPGNDTAHWPYTLAKLTQYWRVPGRDVQPDLRVRVNARRVYWASTAPVLGGIAFENFEVRQRYIPGQTFVFGISPQEPDSLYDGLCHLKPYAPAASVPAASASKVPR